MHVLRAVVVQFCLGTMIAAKKEVSLYFIASLLHGFCLLWGAVDDAGHANSALEKRKNAFHNFNLVFLHPVEQRRRHEHEVELLEHVLSLVLVHGALAGGS